MKFDLVNSLYESTLALQASNSTKSINFYLKTLLPRQLTPHKTTLEIECMQTECQAGN